MKYELHIEDSVGVIINDSYFDLHNLFNFDRLEIASDKTVVAFHFFTHPDFIAETKGKKKIRLIYSGVDFLEISPEFFKKSGLALNEIGFKSPGDNDLDWILNKDQASTDDHVFYRFHSDEYAQTFSADEYVRIHSTDAYAEIEEL